jgi:hypothetical protein
MLRYGATVRDRLFMNYWNVLKRYIKGEEYHVPPQAQGVGTPVLHNIMAAVRLISRRCERAVDHLYSLFITCDPQ